MRGALTTRDLSAMRAWTPPTEAVEATRIALAVASADVVIILLVRVVVDLLHDDLLDVDMVLHFYYCNRC